MKKGIILAVLLVFTLTFLFGCGSGQKSQESAASSQGQSQTEEIKEPASIDSDYVKKVLKKGAQAYQKGLSCDVVISGTGGANSSGAYWIQGDNIKMISKMEGFESVTISDGTTMTTYDPVKKTGMQYKLGKEGMTGEEMDIKDNYDDSDLKYIGKEEYDGQKCLVVMETNKTDNTTTKLWINQKMGLAVKIEGKAEDGTTFTTELKNIKIGEVSKETFKVPSDIKLESMPAN